MTAFSHGKPGRSGVALVIVLAFVVLLSGLIVAYLANSANERQLANSSFTGSEADQLATSALDTVVGDLKQEIVNGSYAINGNSGTTPVYLPGGNSSGAYVSNGANMLPARSGNPAFAAGTPDPIPNLVRISNHSDPAPAAATAASPFVGSRASNVPSSTLSANGRNISAKRWNKHYLIPRATPTSSSLDPTPVSSFTMPDWVMVTREHGPTVLTSPTADANGKVTVLGRYAYAMYDEGGLLDLNVAGYPASGTTTAQTSGKADAAFADLTQLVAGSVSLTTAQINSLIGWRNYASAKAAGDFASGFTFDTPSAANYFNLLIPSTANSFIAPSTANGFMKVAAATPRGNGNTDQAFLSRQQLIDYWTNKNISPDLLQFFGTFSREKNAPSWRPLYDAADMLDGTTGNASSFAASFQYKKNAESGSGSSGPTNPDVLFWRFGQAATLNAYALDGTPSKVQVNAGDPIVWTRFCLNRIKWLTPQGPDTTIPNVNDAILQYFGLVWGQDSKKLPCWVYTSPSGNNTPATSIKTLAAVAAENPPREPDFFELLQAGILSGSVGLDAGPVGAESGGGKPAVDGPAGDTRDWDDASATQILQIGANIIDQYDSDSYPTEIAANLGKVSPCEVRGIENLPYLYAVYMGIFRKDSSHREIGGWFLPEVWNVHQKSINVTSGPTNFRFFATGFATLDIFPPGTYNPPSPANLPHISGSFSMNADPTKSLSYVSFSAPTSMEPVLLDQNNASASIPDNNATTAQMTFTTGYAPYTNPATGLPYGPGIKGPFTTNKYPHIGMYAGSVIDTDPAETDTSIPHYTAGTLLPTATFYLEYQDGQGSWHTYSTLKSLKNAAHGDSYADLFTGIGLTYGAFRSDPRTDRFSLSEVFENLGNSEGSSLGFGLPNHTLWQNYATNGDDVLRYCPSSTVTLTTSHFNYTQGSGSFTPPANDAGNPWQLSENRLTPSVNGYKNSTEYYVDMDGVLRRAEGAYDAKVKSTTTPINSNPADGHPLATGNMASRPVMLNRPFRNVAELGYAFRDLPWRNLDFFTPESADSALLDLFSVDDGNNLAVTAGHVNLNTRQPLVMQALLSGAGVIEPSASATTATTISAADAKTLAAAIAARSSAKPFVNRAELVTPTDLSQSLGFRSANDTDKRFNGTSVNLTSLSFSSSTPNIIKAQRESIVRALGDATTTRTWNLLIDVVAQTGRYAPGASSLSQFTVTGERRYWLHVAVDRYTGEVVDRVLEPVYE